MAWERWKPPSLCPSGTITKSTLAQVSGRRRRDREDSDGGLSGGKTEACGTSTGKHLQSHDTVNTSTQHSGFLSSRPRIQPWNRARVASFQHKVPAHVNTPSVRPNAWCVLQRYSTQETAQTGSHANVGFYLLI